MDDFNRKKYLYYSEKWKGDFPEKNPEFKKNLNYFQPNFKEVKKLEEEFIDEITMEKSDWVKERRLEFLDGESKRINKEIIFWIKKVNCYEGWFSVLMIRVCAKPFVKELNEVYREIDMYKNPKVMEMQDVSEEDIERARDADCSQFVEVKKKVGGKSWSLCPFHNERTPSFCCYEGRKGFYCYGCGFGGDSITLVRKLHGLGFKDAVKFINKQ